MQPDSTPATGGRAGVALSSIFLSPTKAFGEIARGASWVVPLLICAVMAIGGSILQKPAVDLMSEARMAKVPEEHRAQAEKMAQTQSTMQVVMTPAIIAIGLLISAGIFLGVGKAMGNGALNFKKVFTGLAYAGLIPAVGSLLTSFLIQHKAASGDLTSMADFPRTGLDLLGGEGFVRGLLSAFGPFSIWWLVVLVFGFAVLTGRTPRQVAPSVIVPGILLLLILGAFAGLGFAFGS